MPSVAHHRAVSPALPNIPKPSVHARGATLAGLPVVAPSNAALRSAIQARARPAAGGAVSRLLQSAHAKTKDFPSLRCIIEQVFREKGYTDTALHALLEKHSKSLVRYDSAFRLFCAVGLEMGYSFPGVSTAQVASILSTIDVDSAPQARSAFAALQKFPTMHSLQFDPAIRAMRQHWNRSTPKYTDFWSVEALVARLLGQPLDWSSRFQLRSRLIIALRLFQLYRSFDCANMVRLWGNIDDQWFMPTRRKGWSTLRWDRILRLQGLDHMCPFSLLTAYINVTTEGASSDGSPGPVFLAVTRPFSPLSPARISSLTKEILQDAGVDADFFGAHSTRGAGLDLLRQLGLLAEQSAEVGSWANLTAFNSHYSRLGAKDFLAKALQSRCKFSAQSFKLLVLRSLPFSYSL